MRDYEVTIENRKNTIWSNFLEPIRMVVSVEINLFIGEMKKLMPVILQSLQRLSEEIKSL